MATSRWRKSLSVIERLLKKPQKFDFFQSVRLLEKASLLSSDEDRQASEVVAKYSQPSKESIRFSSEPSLAFNNADVSSVSKQEITSEEGATQQWQMEVDFMGLTGSQGIMPYYLSETVNRELRYKNTGLKEFLDIFNHRSISMYYQAWHKYQLPVNYERAKQNNAALPDNFSHALKAISGIGLDELTYRMPVADDALCGMAGIAGRTTCTAEGLRGMLKHYFGVDTEINQFQLQRQELPEDVLTRLPGSEVPKGINNKLGVNSILGSHGFHAQSKFSVKIIPKDNEQFMALSPGSKKLEALKTFIHFNAGTELDFDIVIQTNIKDIQPAQFKDEENYQPLLGWNTHMSDGQAEEVLITSSQDISSPDSSLPLAH